MIKTIEAKLSDEDFAAFSNGSRKEREQLIEDFYKSLETFQHVELLGDFCDGERESFNDDQIVTSVSLDGANSGTIDVEFTGSTYFGCDDMNILYDHSEVVLFEVDTLTGVVEFRSEPPDLIDRPPNDEF